MGIKTVKLGVVGLGRGKDVALELVNDKNVKITAICDKNPELLAKGIELFKNGGFSTIITRNNRIHKFYCKSNCSAFGICYD